MKNYKILFYLLAFILGIIVASRCKKEVVKTEKVQVVERYTDTTLVIKEIPYKVYVPTEILNTIVTDSCKYYTLNFKKDSSYSLITYGGYIDSIDLTIFEKERTIRDSIIVTNTIINTIEVKNPYKNSVSVEYMYNMHNNVLLDYTRNFNRFSIGGKIGINIGNKSPVIGAKIGLSF